MQPCAAKILSQLRLLPFGHKPAPLSPEGKRVRGAADKQLSYSPPYAISAPVHPGAALSRAGPVASVLGVNHVRPVRSPNSVLRQAQDERSGEEERAQYPTSLGRGGFRLRATSGCPVRTFLPPLTLSLPKGGLAPTMRRERGRWHPDGGVDRRACKLPRQRLDRWAQGLVSSPPLEFKSMDGPAGFRSGLCKPDEAARFSRAGGRQKNRAGPGTDRRGCR